MADAPSGGGSSNWGPFEIILGILLLISLISTITGKKITPAVQTKEDTPKETISVVDQKNARCGLSVSAPLSLEKVSGTVRLAGSINGCNWNPDGSTALFVQVVNASGAPVSDFVSVPALENGFMTTAFEATIAITGSPTGTGYLILIPAVQKEQPLTVRIPLQFVRK